MAKKNVVTMPRSAETKPESEVIEYQSSNVPAKRLRVWVEGKTSVMTHNPASMQNKPKTKKGGNIPAPEEEAEAGTYRMENGACALKGESFAAALIEAASDYKVQNKRYSWQRLLEHVTVVEDLVPLLHKDGTEISDYTIDARRAVIGKAGVIRHRPKFEIWQTAVTFEYDPLLVPEANIELLVEILADAGNRKGVGDYRPRFGRFNVLRYQLVG